MLHLRPEARAVCACPLGVNQISDNYTSQWRRLLWKHRHMGQHVLFRVINCILDQNNQNGKTLQSSFTKFNPTRNQMKSLLVLNTGRIDTPEYHNTDPLSSNG